jgi:DEAD/DEAH box helicase domain-containing protein
LNRHDALRLLSEQFLAALKLPEGLRAFGPPTMLEYEPLRVALSREARWATTIRIILGGDPTKWDLEEWPLTRQLARWTSDGTKVELLLLSSVRDRLDVASRNLIAAWVEAAHVTAVQLPNDPKLEFGAQLVGEVGDASQHARFAVFDEAATAPGTTWGLAGEHTHVVSARYSTGLPPLPSDARVLQADELRVTPTGAIAAITLATSLNGGVNDFGKRFWAEVLRRATGLQERLSSQIPIERVVYKDRYVKSPLTMRLLLEVVRALTERSGTAMATAEATLTTLEAGARPSRFEPHSFFHDWINATRRDEVFGIAMAAVGIRGALEELPKARAEHARELRVEWQDGAWWTMRLDEGFGFMTCDRRVAFNFGAPERDQARALLQAQFDVRARNRTHVYVFPVQLRA